MRALWSSSLFLLGSLAWSAVLAAASPEEVDAAAVRAARAVDGTIVPCPETWRNFTESRRCVRAPETPEKVKARLNRALGETLVTAWRAQTNPVFSYNYVRTASSLVGVVAGPATREGDSTLLVLDSVPDRADTRRDEGGVRLVPQPRASAPTAPRAGTSARTETPPSASAKPSIAAPAATATVSPDTPAFTRVLALREPRMNGEDVRRVQNRLMDVARLPRGGGGDGWFGPVTSATVRAFQAANGLKVTGTVDRATWARLFSADARPFDPRAVDALLGR
ncbi:peptidoglycan-binding domain-containing protein [Deinococcus pimensis]|uniref:peptidoglycan-binding domain-containing protein n=1 Tax=Deinococcus pimensis TaxID=309888 RepID=UPI0005EB903B|nr:peptidoglycan-binding domain-containing protein [Deinococcus pimensis]